MIRLKLFILFSIVAFGLHAQMVTLDLPAHKERAVVMMLRQGTRSDTIFNGTLNNKGQAIIPIPKEYKDYRGMAAVQPAHPGALFEFIVAGENVTLSCPDLYPNGENVVFKNSPENTALQKWFAEQSVRGQKIGMLSELLRLYDKGNILFPLMENEKKIQEKEQVAFEKELKVSSLYAARLIELHNFLNSKVAGLAFADSKQMDQVRQYITDTLDVNSLYTSGLWFDMINGSLAIYDMRTPFHYDFVHDMANLLNRADDKVYTTLAENLFAICESTGWNDLEEQLAYLLINDGRIKNPTGKLQMLMNLFKLTKGSKVPELAQGKLPKGKSLLVFYESGCGPCENEMQQLKGNYPLLKQKGYEVVSVAADTDADVFRNTAETFPWKQKYCDLKGFDSPDFRNFGVIGTPTFYVIDEKGILQGRYARLQDTSLIGN